MTFCIQWIDLILLQTYWSWANTHFYNNINNSCKGLAIRKRFDAIIITPISSRLWCFVSELLTDGGQMIGLVGWISGWTGGCLDERTDGRVRMDGWTPGRMTVALHGWLLTMSTIGLMTVSMMESCGWKYLICPSARLPVCQITMIL